MYSCSTQLFSFEINLISKEISWAQPEYMDMHPSVTALNLSLL